MPIHRGPRLDDMISRLVGIAQPLRANIYQTWPNLGIPAQLTSGASAGTYGAWTEMVSAANAPNEPFTVAYMDFAAGEGRNMVFQLGIGASGSEVPVTTFLGNAYGYANGYGISYPTVFPYIPGGTRLALRMRSDYAGSISTSRSPRIVTCRLPKTRDSYSILRLANKLAPYNYYAGDGPDIYGTSTTTRAAWAYDSSYSQVLGTSQTTPFIITAWGAGGNVTPANFSYFQEALAYGPSGGETVCAELAYGALNLYSSAYYKLYNPIHLPFPLIVPPATRLAMKQATDLGWNGTSGSYSWFGQWATLNAANYI